MNIKNQRRVGTAAIVAITAAAGTLSLSGCGQGEMSCISANGPFNVYFKHESGDETEGICAGLKDQVLSARAQTYFGRDEQGQPSLDQMSVAIRFAAVGTIVTRRMQELDWLEARVKECGEDDANPDELSEQWGNSPGHMDDPPEDDDEEGRGGDDGGDDDLPPLTGCDDWQADLDALKGNTPEWGQGNNWGYMENAVPDASDKCQVDDFDEQAGVPELDEGFPARQTSPGTAFDTAFLPETPAQGVETWELTDYVIDVSAANQGTTYTAKLKVAGQGAAACEAEYTLFGMFPPADCIESVDEDSGDVETDIELCFEHGINPDFRDKIKCDEDTQYQCMLEEWF